MHKAQVNRLKYLPANQSTYYLNITPYVCVVIGKIILTNRIPSHIERLKIPCWIMVEVMITIVTILMKRIVRAGCHRAVTGFTIIEILIVILVIGIIAGFTYSLTAGGNHIEKARLTRAKAELGNIANAGKLYRIRHNEWPRDVGRGTPPGIEEFLQTSTGNNTWPTPPWPGSWYDFDNWPPDIYSSVPTIQISIYFCDYHDDVTCKKNFPDEPWLDKSTWESHSSIYYCIQGACRPHENRPPSWPGYCVNCKQIY